MTTRPKRGTGSTVLKNGVLAEHPTGGGAGTQVVHWSLDDKNKIACAWLQVHDRATETAQR